MGNSKSSEMVEENESCLIEYKNEDCDKLNELHDLSINIRDAINRMKMGKGYQSTYIKDDLIDTIREIGGENISDDGKKLLDNMTKELKEIEKYEKKVEKKLEKINKLKEKENKINNEYRKTDYLYLELDRIRKEIVKLESKLPSGEGGIAESITPFARILPESVMNHIDKLTELSKELQERIEARCQLHECKLCLPKE